MATDLQAKQSSSADLPRRHLLTGLMTGAGGMALATSASRAEALALPRHPTLAQWNVLEFGAKGDGKTDNTKAFQVALDAAAKGGGGTVFAPAGQYHFAGTLKVPSAVTLAGTFSAMAAHTGIRDTPQRMGAGVPFTVSLPGTDGTTLMPTAGRGQEEGDPFILLDTNSTLKGVVVWYPEQDPKVTPVPYPWTVEMRGINSAVLDVELLNPYQGININGAHRHYVRGVSGQPLRRGIQINGVMDIGRIADVHFNPWWSMTDTVIRWTTKYGEAFIIGRTDWQYMSGCFMLGYQVGYRFMDGMSNVLLTQCGGNDSSPVAIRVEQSIGTWGVAFINGQFSGAVEVAASNSGPVKFSNCGFYQDAPLRLAGSGPVLFTGCHFQGAAIQASSPLTITGCDLYGSKIDIDAATPGAVIVGNQRVGEITDASKKAQIGFNTAS